MKQPHVILTICALALSVFTSAQDKPDWISKLPKEANNTYRYVKESAIASTENEARTQAIARVFQSTGNRLGQPVDAAEINLAVQQGTDYNVISRTFNIPINKVCEYTERLKDGSYRVYVLCQVAEKGNIQVQWSSYNQCSAVQESKNSVALVKSIFIPGFGQIGKHRYVEGALTMIGEIVLVGAGTGCYFLAQDQLDIMKADKKTVWEFTDARDKYENYRKASYVIWGSAAGLYVFNLIRAYTAQPKLKSSITLHPVITPTDKNATAVGIGLSYKF
jgi:hypothetical protein